VRAFIHVTDLVEGVKPIDLTDARLTPLLASYLGNIPVPGDTQPRDEIYIVVKGTVQMVTP